MDPFQNFRAEVKLSYLSKEQHFLEDICSQRSLSFNHLKSNKDHELFEIAVSLFSVMFFLHFYSFSKKI